MNPTLVPGTRFESQFQICVYEHAILYIYISFFSNITSNNTIFFVNLTLFMFFSLQKYFFLDKNAFYLLIYLCMFFL